MKAMFDFFFKEVVSLVTVRLYFASVIAPYRRAHGQRSSIFVDPSQTRQLAVNRTNNVLTVAVSRADVGPTAQVRFGDQDSEGASSYPVVQVDNDFHQIFILRPGEQLFALPISTSPSVALTVAQEFY